MNQSTTRRKIGRLSPFAVVAAAAVLSACGSSSGDSTAASSTTSVAASAESVTETNSSTITGGAAVDTAVATPSASGANSGPSGGGPGAFGKNVDASTITTVDQLNALINEAYGDGGLGLHRGHQPVEQVLIDTLGISHDEMHVRMDAGQNLSDIAEDQGVGTETLINALVDNWQPAIDQVEAEGLITADQAAAYHQALVDAFTFKVTWNGSDQAPTFSGV